MALGLYPEVSLLEACKRAFNARELAQSQPPVDPQEKKAHEKDLKLDIKANTFKVWAGKWFDHWKHSVSKPHAEYKKRKLDIDINPFVGDKAIARLEIEYIKDAFNKCVER